MDARATDEWMEQIPAVKKTKLKAKRRLSEPVTSKSKASALETPSLAATVYNKPETGIIGSDDTLLAAFKRMVVE